MINNFLKIKDKGFSLVEVLVSVALFSIILIALISFLLTMNNSNTKTLADREVSENARRALEEIAYEIRSAKSIYTPTTTANQISLEKGDNLPDGETETFVDIFLCGNTICLKREFQTLVFLTPDSVQVTSLVFLQISNNNKPSVQINLTANHKNPSNDVNYYSSINLTSTASLRGY